MGPRTLLEVGIKPFHTLATRKCQKKLSVQTGEMISVLIGPVLCVEALI